MVSSDEIRTIIEAYPADRRYTLAIMQDLQRKYNHVPRQGLDAMVEYLGVSLAQLYAMATFYKALSLQPRGRHIIRLCDGTACHIRGANQLIGGVTRLLGIGPHETTGDGLFSLDIVNCLGSCAIAPVMVIDDTCYGKVTLERLPEILGSYKEAAL